MSFTCNKVISFYTWMYSQVCTSAFPATNTSLVMVATTLGDDRSSTITTTASENGFNAFGVQIIFQSADFQSGITARTSTAETEMATATAASTGGSSITPTGDSSATTQGLTTGAAFGIGIGCGILLFGIARAIAWLLIRRRKKTNPIMMDTPTQLPPDVYPNKTSEQHYAAEMSSKCRPHELVGGTMHHTHELPGAQYSSDVYPLAQDPTWRGS
jgi:hypothetical protein